MTVRQMFSHKNSAPISCENAIPYYNYQMCSSLGQKIFTFLGPLFLDLKLSIWERFKLANSPALDIFCCLPLEFISLFFFQCFYVCGFIFVLKFSWIISHCTWIILENNILFITKLYLQNSLKTFISQPRTLSR